MTQTDPLARYANLSEGPDGKIALSDAEWRELLSPEEFHILREGGTEMRGTGPLTDHEAEGAYHCAGCGLHLYGSEHKFHSGCGWPAFDDEVPNAVTRIEDRSHGMVRTEIRCRRCDAHLGHVFPDGPPPTGLRYCINSVCLELEPDQG